MKIKIITDEYVEFDNGSKITYDHSPDCCEEVYCDFLALIDSPIMNMNIDKIEIELVENSGFRLNGFFVPCYNKQNGYYSSNLTLRINEGKSITEYDLNDGDPRCIIDYIY